MTWAELHAGGDDDAFYSPKSSASFSSDASFVSTTEQLGRSPFEGEGFGDDLTRASSGMVSASLLLENTNQCPEQFLCSIIVQAMNPFPAIMAAQHRCCKGCVRASCVWVGTL